MLTRSMPTRTKARLILMALAFFFTFAITASAAAGNESHNRILSSTVGNEVSYTIKNVTSTSAVIKEDSKTDTLQKDWSQCSGGKGCSSFGQCCWDPKTVLWYCCAKGRQCCPEITKDGCCEIPKIQ